MSKLKVHYFQHIAGEGFGSCHAYLQAMGAHITATEFFALPQGFQLDIEAFPYVDDVDLLIIMGGEMSVNDEVNYPWLKTEKRWLRRYLSTQKPIIGLCLGGQLIASALGARVSRNAEQERGWTRVYRSQEVPEHYFQLPDEITVMQWHSETFELPKGAVRLAENTVCHNQLYQIGRKILGFQFHPEMTAHSLAVLIENDEQTVFEGPHVQSIQQLKQSSKADFQAEQLLLKQAIDYVLCAD